MYQGPGREWREASAEAVPRLTAELRAPGGSQVLRPLQAVVLDEGPRIGGAFVYAIAGGGKTICAGALPVRLAALGFRRPLILTTGAMVRETRSEFTAARAHWRLATFFEIQSYSWLARAEQAQWLEQWRPDVIICDEAHKLRNYGAGGAAVPKRVARYLAANPHVQVYAMSGTFHKSKITDYAHILRWCLKDQSPLPDDANEVEAWSAAIDDGDAYGLRSLAKYGCPVDDWDAAKEWYAQRLRRCPGVIISDEEFTDSQLCIDVVHADPGCSEAFEALRERKERPDGWALIPGRAADDDQTNDLATAGTVWQVARQLALGFYYTFDPQPPQPWLQARKRWARYVRAVIESGLADTELQVRIACEQGAHRVPEWEEWRDLGPTFVPNTVARWLDDRALRFAAHWGSSGPRRAVWYEHRAVGARLEELTGWRHYGPRGLDRAGRHVRDARSADGPIILSRPANFEGRNLQHEWSESMMLGIPNANMIFEQQVARMHRPGQRMPEVRAVIYAGCVETQNSLINILRGAQHSHATTTLPQRMLRARIQTFGDVPADSWAWCTAKRDAVRERTQNVSADLAQAYATY